MAYNTFVAIGLGYILTDKTLMARILSNFTFFNDKKHLTRALEILIGAIFLIYTWKVGFLYGLRFLLAVVFFLCARMKIAEIPVPKYLKGEPIILVVALVVAIVFFGLS